MSSLSDYTPAEVATLTRAPLIVGMMVVGASLSGPLGVVKELLAAVHATEAASKQAPETSILRSLFANPRMRAQQEQLAQEKPETLDPAMQLQKIRQALFILASKGDPSELAAYKALLLKAAEDTANAAKEGGFLGIGGTRVSEQEQAVIDQIRALTTGA